MCTYLFMYTCVSAVHMSMCPMVLLREIVISAYVQELECMWKLAHRLNLTCIASQTGEHTSEIVCNIVLETCTMACAMLSTFYRV